MAQSATASLPGSTDLEQQRFTHVLFNVMILKGTTRSELLQNLRKGLQSKFAKQANKTQTVDQYVEAQVKVFIDNLQILNQLFPFAKLTENDRARLNAALRVQYDKNKNMQSQWPKSDRDVANNQYISNETVNKIRLLLSFPAPAPPAPEQKEEEDEEEDVRGLNVADLRPPAPPQAPPQAPQAPQAPPAPPQAPQAPQALPKALQALPIDIHQAMEVMQSISQQSVGSLSEQQLKKWSASLRSFLFSPQS